MAVKRKRLGEVVQENPNSKHLRSGRTVEPQDKPLKSRNSRLVSSRPYKRVLNEAVETDILQNEDPEVARTRRPLKMSKVANPSYQPLSTRDAKGMGCGEICTVAHQKVNRLHTSEETIIYSSRTPKRNKAIVEIPSSPHQAAMERVSQVRRYLPPEKVVMDDTNAFADQLPVCLAAQKEEILKRLQISHLDNPCVPSTEEAARRQLSEMIQGTITRGEGNSCIVLGPRGSGKTRIVESCVQKFSGKPIVLRLTGWIQTTDKQALREIATQLLHQTGSYLLSDTDPPDPTFVDDENPFIEHPQLVQDSQPEQSMRLPPSSQLHSLIPVLLTLKRPVVVILDAFDLFALHPRQSLLYCLLDNVQSCRSASGSQGIAVVGITSRVDTIQLLEKRVKSRFSGRIIRTAPPDDVDQWLSIAKNILLVPITLQEEWLNEKWQQNWISSVEDFLSDSKVLDVFRETFGISKDVRVLIRLLTHSVLHLRPSEPYLCFKTFSASVVSQRSRPRYTHVRNLSYPMVCLIIASSQIEITGHPTFSFEMLSEKFRDQVRASTSAPVQLNGGHVGMVKCTREVLLAAFDDLVSSHIFLPSVGLSSVQAKEFIKFRCTLDREGVKKMVEISGQIHLKKWFTKG